MKRLLALLVIAGVGVPSAAAAQEHVLQFRSMEDPNTPPDPAVCARAPFAVNALLGASLWSFTTRSRDGEVKNDDVRRIGSATACVQLTNFAFPPGLDQNFYVEFQLREGTLVAEGTCKLVSNDVPEAGLVLAGCSLKVVSGPPGTVGGMVTSSSVFNPFHRQGFNTGSYWTALLYTDGDPHPHEGSGAASAQPGLQLFEDTRSDAAVRAARSAAGL